MNPNVTLDMSLFESNKEFDIVQGWLVMVVNIATIECLNINESFAMCHQMTCLMFCGNYRFRYRELVT